MCTVLVVEDTDSIRYIMGRLLRHCGYEAVCVENGQRALVQFEQALPDLILLDLQMPVMDGISLLKAMRADPRWRDLPVIVLTSEDSGGPIGEALRLGAKECLIKTKFTAEQLLDSIKKHADA